MLIGELLNLTIKDFRENNIEEPVLKAKLIISFSISKSKEYLTTHNQEELSVKQMEYCYNNIKKVIMKQPVQYIIGYQEFMKLDFKVNKEVLIPRPDTEILVQEIIDLVGNKKMKILDLCTGSGIIAISLAKYLPNCKIVASDISLKALKIAKENSQINNVVVKFIESDIFKNINEKFDIIVSNPPYIETNVIKTLSKEVQNEPVLALDGGEDGLDFYREIISKSYLYLTQNGIIGVEIGYNQKKAVMDLFSEKYYAIYSKQDLNGNDRIVIAKKGDKN